MKIVLGTAQFGRNYGIANKTGIISNEEAINIFKLASNVGVSFLDTSTDYHNEEKIRMAMNVADFKIISKLYLSNDNIEWSNNKIESMVHNFTARIGIDQIYALLIHNPDLLFGKFGENLISILNKMRNCGFFQKIGISVYSPEQAVCAMDVFDFDLMEIPCNILDQRFAISGTIDLLKNKNKSVMIFSRSIFLQGLLFMNIGDLDKYFEPVKNPLIFLNDFCNENHISASLLSLQYVKSLSGVDAIIVGVDKCKQLEQIINMYNSDIIANIITKDMFEQFSTKDENLINPANWTVGGWK